MQTQIEQALVAGAETGIVTLQITESQLTSYIALKTAGANQSAIHRAAGFASQRSNANSMAKLTVACSPPTCSSP